MSGHDVGDEWKVVGNLHQIGVPRDSIHVDDKLSPPHIIIEASTREIGDLIRTIARIRNLKKEKIPLIAEATT